MDEPPRNWHKEQCEALTKTGIQCRRRCRAYFPCQAVYDARLTSYHAISFRPVHLCHAHVETALRLRSKNLRLPLVQKGFFGAYNRHGYGNLVTAEAAIDWEEPKLTIPKLWAVAPSTGLGP